MPEVRYYTYNFSGDLALRIDGWYDGRKSWSDGKTQRLEALKQDVDNGIEKPRDGGKGRVTWHCPRCRERAWAKPSTALACGLCDVALIRR